MLRFVVGGALLLSFVACASSSREACDPTQVACPGLDSGTHDSTSIDAAPDALKLGFGSPCSGNSQCQSDLCLVVPTGGVCTEECGVCPTGWGCFSVGQDGEFESECVPLSSELCTPCSMDTECTQVGMDKCLSEADGSFCARDCSTISCPDGYDCTPTDVNGTNYQECIPHSGACDCNTAAQMGGTNACQIATTFGRSCAGSETCAGVAGWSTCMPPSTTDDPDGTYTDDNCDGIDGDITKGIFVAGSGADTATCGLVYTDPCATISYGIVRAVQASKQNVYVQAGTYNEVVVLLNGVNVWGGYDATWIRASYSTAGHTVTITGKQDTTTGGDGEYLAVRAHSLIVPVTMGDLIIQAPNAQGDGGNSGLDGKASYAVHANQATVNLVRVEIIGGAGASGGTGAAGTDAVVVDPQSYMSGGTGGAGAQVGNVCNDSTRGGPGSLGTNTCSASPSSRAMNGGSGGQGGTEDTDCGIFSLDLDATPGAAGTSASFVFGTFGTPGGGGTGVNSCGPAGNGNSGVDANGSAGAGANTGGYVIGNGYWYATAGKPGATGENGSGGGGGGGAGGCDNGNDSYGGGGGGGGAGGCAARSGGGGGGGGGGSFGIFAAGGSTVNASSCQLVIGAGAVGGTGGTGGRGQSGGAQGQPGARAANGSSPGLGGAGAHGGHGGGGGGGQGGRGVGIGWTPGSTINQTCTFTDGSAGGGGVGGVAAPTAPASDRDGNNGGAGSPGTLDQTRACTSTSAC